MERDNGMIFIQLFLSFLKIGAFTFGGGYAMIPLIRAEVMSQGWLEEQALVDFIAVSESTPGPLAVNLATFVGTVTGGIFGALCATFGIVLPSFVIILIVAKFFTRFQDNRIVKGCLFGLKAAVIGLLAAAVLSVGRTVFFPDGMITAQTGSVSAGLTELFSHVFSVEFLISLVIFAVAAFLLIKKRHPIAVICICACMGVAAGIITSVV